MSDRDDEYVTYLNEEQWAWLMQLLDEPPRVIPKLRELLSRPTVFDTEDEA